MVEHEIHFRLEVVVVPVGLLLTVEDMDAAYELLTSRGVALGEIVTLGAERRPGFRHVFFEDPDGNGWAIQEIRASSAPARPGTP